MYMAKSIIKKLNFWYYGVMCMAVLVAALMYFLLQKGCFVPLDVNSPAGMAVQYSVILDTLLTLPLGLWLFKRRCRRICAIEDEEQRLSEYGKYAVRRILTVGNSLVFGMAAFYLLGGFQSMLWLAAVAAIGLYFCKPTERKMQLELLPYDDSY